MHAFFPVFSLLQSADENLNFEEQILEAAKNIAGATSALVKSATAAQRELVAQGKLSSNPQSEDGQWSEGLVSAVRYTHLLCHVLICKALVRSIYSEFFRKTTTLSA